MAPESQDDQEKPSAVSFLGELKRRKVTRAAIAYLVIAWLLLQVADVLFPALSLPEWTVRFVAGLLVLGFPLVLVLSWAFDLGPDGLKREVSDAPAMRAFSKRWFAVAVAVLAVVAIASVGYFSDHPGDAPSIEELEKSIAVLPFADMSAEGDQEYFADGVSEELLILLARVPELRVIGRTSSFQFKGQQEDLRLIGEKLGVTHVLDGSVRKFGDTVRITAQLVDTRDGANLWSDRFDRKIENILALQDEIATSVVDTLKVELLGYAASRQASATITDHEAYDLYLKGQHFRRQLEIDQAIEFFHRAIALDPSMAAAWEGLAVAYANQVTTGAVSPDTGLPRAIEARDRALALNPNLAGIHYTDGFLKLAFQLDLPGATEAFRRAIKVEPNHPGAYSGLSVLAVARGDFAQAIANINRANRIDPLSLPAMHNRAFIYYVAGEFEQAEQSVRSAIEFAGGSYPIGHYVLALTLLAQGRTEEAMAAANQEQADPHRLAARAVILHAQGQDLEAQRVLSDFIERFDDQAANHIAYVQAVLGNGEAAVHWLHRALEQREPNVAYARFHPLLQSIQGQVSYEAFLRQAGLI